MDIPFQSIRSLVPKGARAWPILGDRKTMSQVNTSIMRFWHNRGGYPSRTKLPNHEYPSIESCVFLLMPSLISSSVMPSGEPRTGEHAT